MGKHQKYTNELKLSIVKRYLENGESTEGLAQELGANHSDVARWIRKYRSGGEAELFRETRGVKSKGRPKKNYENLAEELKQVKMERDLLKKVLTLKEELIKK